MLHLMHLGEDVKDVTWGETSVLVRKSEFVFKVVQMIRKGLGLGLGNGLGGKWHVRGRKVG